MNTFVVVKRQELREVRDALEKRQRDGVTRPPDGSLFEEGAKVLVRETVATLRKEGLPPKLTYEYWTGPWEVTVVVQSELSHDIIMHGHVSIRRMR